ncbi:hypothetical protein [Streptomyces seoulensis]|uniref:hypothetical protein n=1 Tax=Streptomyces seoulensis TaxID=73044 RepID=UPI001FCAA9BE|nr:hypothetical protein [Streptomyces seoulensis]BDH03665.1 hypothetical protein HEK131_08920 [Streptomyces seoulensis]
MSARNRRLPRDRAWPLTTTDVSAHLGPLMSRITELRFLTGLDSGTIVLGAAWVAPLSRNHGRGMHPDSVGFRVDVHPVAAGERAAVRDVLRAQALPRLHEWIAEESAATETWRLTPHERLWHLTDGRLTHEDDPDRRSPASTAHTGGAARLRRDTP